MPKTVYVSLHREHAGEGLRPALASAEFTPQSCRVLSLGRSSGWEIEHKVGGDFTMRMPDGRFDLMLKSECAVGHRGWDAADSPPDIGEPGRGGFRQDFRELTTESLSDLTEIEPMGASVQAHDDGGPPMGRARQPSSPAGARAGR